MARLAILLAVSAMLARMAQLRADEFASGGNGPAEEAAAGSMPQGEGCNCCCPPDRGGCLYRLWQWLTYYPPRCHCCSHECCGNCCGHLYTFFLCDCGCGSYQGGGCPGPWCHRPCPVCAPCDH